MWCMERLRSEVYCPNSVAKRVKQTALALLLFCETNKRHTFTVICRLFSEVRAEQV